MRLRMIIPNPVSGGNCDYNSHNLPTVPKGTWNAPYDQATGSVYSLPLSAKPGVHDVADADPQFVDRTRNLPVLGYIPPRRRNHCKCLGKVTGEPIPDQRASLLPYIRARFKPRNPAYGGAAHDPDQSPLVLCQ